MACSPTAFVPLSKSASCPKKLASRLDYHAFWYKQIVSPPKD